MDQKITAEEVMEEIGKEHQTETDGKAMKVLLVDDEQNVLRSLKRVLRHEPFELITANSGEEALEILANTAVQLIVSDQRMPGMSGIEFLEKARQLCPDTIRVALTGYSDLKTAEDAINRVEIYRFLLKPWNDQDLISTIRQGLNKWRLQQENRRMLKTIQEQNRKLRQYNGRLEQMVEERTRSLRETQSQLIQSEKMASLGVLAGGVAHEINNPLGGILGMAQLLLMEHGEEEQLARDLKHIENAALLCSEIVKNLLAFSRKSEAPSREAASMPRITDQVMLLIGHLFRHAEISVQKDFEPGFPKLLVNEKQMQQVMMNLLVNAQQAVGKKGVVRIRGRRWPAGELMIEVEDTGVGIPENELKSIFDPFFTTKPEGEGTGLGLSVSYCIIKEHGGRFEVESEPGRGTTMRMVLPAGLEAENNGQAARSEATRPGAFLSAE